MNVHPVPVWIKAPVWTVWQVSPVGVSFLTVDPLVLRSSPLVPLTLVPIMLSAHIHQITWAINVTASQGGKVSNLPSQCLSIYCLIVCLKAYIRCIYLWYWVISYCIHLLHSLGQLCNIDVNECISNPCKNRGTCTNTLGGFMCSCRAGYTGLTCETDINDCASSKWPRKLDLLYYCYCQFLSNTILGPYTFTVFDQGHPLLFCSVRSVPEWRFLHRWCQFFPL